MIHIDVDIITKYINAYLRENGMAVTDEVGHMLNGIETNKHSVYYTKYINDSDTTIKSSEKLRKMRKLYIDYVKSDYNDEDIKSQIDSIDSLTEVDDDYIQNVNLQTRQEIIGQERLSFEFETPFMVNNNESLMREALKVLLKTARKKLIKHIKESDNCEIHESNNLLDVVRDTHTKYRNDYTITIGDGIEPDTHIHTFKSKMKRSLLLEPGEFIISAKDINDLNLCIHLSRLLIIEEPVNNKLRIEMLYYFPLLNDLEYDFSSPLIKNKKDIK